MKIMYLDFSSLPVSFCWSGVKSDWVTSVQTAVDANNQAVLVLLVSQNIHLRTLEGRIGGKLQWLHKS